ncbi:putative Caskin-1-like [Homarus americanus]|uniref:Putative Caskin-1-like n=1 Tax=Homarus americanus TaxID=6706 RepID=A0A8J5T2T5_HOMAM|nr:putative Caskin-1-like [Homarus americanus]
MLGDPTTHLCRAAPSKDIPQARKGIPEEEDEEGGGGEGSGGGGGGSTEKVGGGRSTVSSSSSNIWGVGWRSEADLPASVAACFEDASLLAKLQNRLLSLVGRASRWFVVVGASGGGVVVMVVVVMVKVVVRVGSSQSTFYMTPLQ